MRETQKGTVLSNLRFQTELFQQYATNLSGMEVPLWPAAWMWHAHGLSLGRIDVAYKLHVFA